ncbi:MAG TPA: hypothetical protein EYP17_10355, partial [Candidatus Latescibacteria bacterium]|nr:hypothetical protein [Candidatus Latescibacterota bacterium]
MPTKVLITPRSFRLDTAATSMLEEAGFVLKWNPHGRPFTEEELIRELAGVEGIIVGIDPLTARVIKDAGSLRAISKYGVGV